MRRGRILILLGLILALGTAAAVFVLLNSTATPTEPAEVQREDVVVAIQPIGEDEPVEGRIDLRPVPVETIPEGALRSLEGTGNMLAAGPIPQGTIIQSDLLVSPEERMQEGELGKLLEPGFVAVALPIDELSSVSYGIQSGDHVDVLMTFFFVDLDQEAQIIEPVCPPVCTGATGEEQEAQVGDQQPRLAAQLTLQDVRILGVGRWEHEEDQPTEEEQAQQQAQQPVAQVLPEYITVMVTPQDALVLKLAREQGLSIDLAVRAQDDAQQFATQQVTLDYIMARFGVSLPGQQPYTVQDVNQAQPRPTSESE
ncbi:MAG: Flp pilus assembly protein CpaB [Anaerolineae bacterium]|jgi:Flp pilus assembly protein CpaB